MKFKLGFFFRIPVSNLQKDLKPSGWDYEVNASLELFIALFRV